MPTGRDGPGQQPWGCSVNTDGGSGAGLLQGQLGWLPVTGQLPFQAVGADPGCKSRVQREWA